MCGFIAAFGVEGLNNGPLRNALKRLYPRGPDAEGVWREDLVCLAHRRLAILDLDDRSIQPMHSECGRYSIVFNGEIYNFRALRAELEKSGRKFFTESDTEVLLHLFAVHGAEMLPMLAGMFAFVIWDKVSRRAFVARDSYGIKPLYVGRLSKGPGVLIASQVKVLLATGLMSQEPDAKGQAGFWLLGSVPEPHTLYRDITAIPSGSYAWVVDNRLDSPVCWSDIGEAWRSPVESFPPVEVVKSSVRNALVESVERHLIADVPIGVFLSGGIDSGALAGLMIGAGAKDIQGVTIAYEEYVGTNSDEAPVASQVARQYGIRHHIRKVTKDEFLCELPQILDAMDQPSIDGVNTWFASKAIAELGLKVVVSGVGGDELFQGYNSFQQLPRIVRNWTSISRFPGVHNLGVLASELQARRSGNRRWRHAANWLSSIQGAWLLKRSLCAPEEIEHLLDPEVAHQLMGGVDPQRWVCEMVGNTPLDLRLALSQIESKTYLRNQLLRDSDWASMAHSIELRTPLVDARLLGSLSKLLGSFYRFPGKSLLGEAPTPSLPKEISGRPKTGFGIPVEKWLAETCSTTSLERRSWAVRVAGHFDLLPEAN